jgi:hypothetical protein
MMKRVAGVVVLSAFVSLGSIVGNGPSVHGAQKAINMWAQRAASSALPRWVNISPPHVSTNPSKPPSNYGFQALALDPMHTRTVYVGTCYQGLWKTTDGGNTWFKVNTGVNGAKLDSGRLWSIAIDHFAPRTLYVANGYGSESGVWKSTDGGIDWQQMLPSTSSVAQQTNLDVSTIVTDPYKGGHVLVAFHGPWGNSAKPQNSGVLESVDGGKTWRVHEPQRGWGWGNYVSFLGNSSTWLMGTQGAGFWRTTNSGNTWTKVASTAVSDGAAAVYRAKNGVWYATAFGTILRSANDGVTWKSVGPYGGYYYAIIGDGTYLYAQQYTSGPVKYYYSRESDGVNWKPYNNQLFAMGSRALAYDPENHIVYSSNGNAGVWKLRTAS